MNAVNIHNEAHNAGMLAGQGCNPNPMVVEDRREGLQYTVDDGLCGFAWIAFAGNTAFGRAMKKANLADTHYPSGLSVWVHDFRQSLARKTEYARAYARVLNANGVKCSVGSRID